MNTNEAIKLVKANNWYGINTKVVERLIKSKGFKISTCEDDEEVLRFWLHETKPKNPDKTKVIYVHLWKNIVFGEKDILFLSGYGALKPTKGSIEFLNEEMEKVEDGADGCQDIPDMNFDLKIYKKGVGDREVFRASVYDIENEWL